MCVVVGHLGARHENNRVSVVACTLKDVRQYSNFDHHTHTHARTRTLNRSGCISPAWLNSERRVEGQVRECWLRHTVVLSAAPLD